MRNPRFFIRNSSKVSRRSISEILKDTEIKPLVLIGKAMDHFGIRPVLGFVFGGSLVWGYSLFDQLPYAGRFANTIPGPEVAQAKTQEDQPKPEKKIMIKGKVTTDGVTGVRRPFQVGVFNLVSGEFSRGDGNFSLELPRQSSYIVAFWKSNYEDLHLFQLDLQDDNTFSPVIWSNDGIPAAETAEKDPGPDGRDKKGRAQVSLFNEELTQMLKGLIEPPKTLEMK